MSGAASAAGRPWWTALVVLVAAAVAAPVVALLVRAFVAGGVAVPDETGRMAVTTVVLLLGVAVGTAALGTGLAWVVSAYEFPFRRTLSWLLVLPLAMPAYVLGFVYLSTFDFAGPVQTGLRALFGDDFGPLPVRSIGGAILVLTLTLYPYVYLLARAAFGEMAPTAYDAARTLGATRAEAFRRALVPLSRPAIAAGLALVMMETLTDFATVQYFDVRTVSVGVYLEWKARYDLDTAVWLVGLVVLFAVAVLAAERLLRGGARYHQRGGRGVGLGRRQLTGRRRWVASGICASVVGIAFVLPVGRLLTWAVADVERRGWSFDPRIWSYLGNSIGVALVAAAGCVAIAVVVAHTLRLGGGRLVTWAAQLTTFGYAVPGAVLGIGVLAVFAALRDVAESGGLDTGSALLITGSVAGVAVAYILRFTAPAFQSIDASFSRLGPSVTASAQSLGAGPGRLLTRVHLPQVRAGVAVGFMVVLIDAIKELPLVLLLRPFGFDTVSVWVYQLAKENFWERAAVPALVIVALATVPVVLLNRRAGAIAR